jgi:hypothetical protein
MSIGLPPVIIDTQCIDYSIPNKMCIAAAVCCPARGDSDDSDGGDCGDRGTCWRLLCIVRFRLRSVR